jgi:cytochrome c oxidase cbb3-type subunit 3
MAWYRLSVLAFAVMALALLGPSEAAAKGDTEKGKAIYEKNCAACHGDQGKGDGPTGKAIVPRATDFTSRASKRKSDAQLLLAIREGRPPSAMTGWKGKLSDQEIDDVLAYVRALSR